jgi:hypothetical protein
MQNDKRKWQMAFRRFVLKNAPSEQYAPYFGLCRKELRAWFEAQFFDGLSWENFGKAWQFEHIIPITWFDSSHEELKACWNFLNIRVSPTEGSSGRPSDLLFAKKHFETLYKVSGFQGCQYYLNKLEFIIGQQVNLPSSETIHFLQSNQIVLDAISTFSPAEYQQYLETGSAKSILTEREILKKFG